MFSPRRIRDVLSRARRLTPAERRVALIAGVALPAAALATRSLGVRRVCRWLETIAARGRPLRPPEPRRVVEIVTRMASASRLPVACLERSIVACLLLRDAGYETTLCVGTANRPRFAAHAWIEIDGTIIGERDDPSEKFATMLRIAPRAR